MELGSIFIDNNNKCDNFYWCERNLYIKPDIKFKFNKYQQDIYKVNDNKKAFLLPRQSGKSTLIAADALATAVQNKNSRIIIFTTFDQLAKNMLHRIEILINNSGVNDIVNSVVSRNMYRIRFENGSTIDILYDVSNLIGIRGDHVYLDDFDSFDSESISRVICIISETKNALVLGSHDSKIVKYINNN